jgi:hypothetical protein
MIFRSYCLAKKIKITFFTLDTAIVTRLDTSDPEALVGTEVESGDEKRFCNPTNQQSSKKRLRRAITAMADIFTRPRAIRRRVYDCCKTKA